MNNYRLGDVADIKFCVVSPGRMKKQNSSTLWLSCSNFSDGNEVVGDPTEYSYCSEPEMKINTGDIVIKRIMPTYVNYIDVIANDLYAGNNLIIVTAKSDVYPKYLAAVLYEKVPSFSAETSVGAVMKSICRPDLEAMIIPGCPYEKQILIGNLWFENIECRKMKIRLAGLEYTKINHEIRHIISKNGGYENE